MTVTHTPVKAEPTQEQLIRCLVDAAPPLNQEQRQTLRKLLGGGR